MNQEGTIRTRILSNGIIYNLFKQIYSSILTSYDLFKDMFGNALSGFLLVTTMMLLLYLFVGNHYNDLPVWSAPIMILVLIWLIFTSIYSNTNNISSQKGDGMAGGFLNFVMINSLFLVAIGYFVLFYLFFILSKFVFHRGVAISFTLGFVMVTLLFALFYNTFLKKFAKNSASFSDPASSFLSMTNEPTSWLGLLTYRLQKIMLNILLLIPCFVNSLFTYVMTDLANISKTNMILFSIVIIYSIIFYIFPFLTSFGFNYNRFPLIPENKHNVSGKVKIDHLISRLDSDKIREHIINAKPFWIREPIKMNQQIKEYLQEQIGQLKQSTSINGNTDDDSEDIHSMLSKKKMWVGGTYNYVLGSSEDCPIDGVLICNKKTNSLKCINPSNNHKTTIYDDAGIKQKCLYNNEDDKIRQQFLESQNKIAMYNKPKHKGGTLMTPSELCRFNYGDTALVDDSTNEYSCMDSSGNNLGELRGYNDIKRNKKFPLLQTVGDYLYGRDEGIDGDDTDEKTTYNPKVHKLDVHVDKYKELQDIFSPEELKILARILDKNQGDTTNEPEEFELNTYLTRFKSDVIKFINEDQTTMEQLMNTIHDYNESGNTYILQESSGLVTLMDLKYGIHKHNYHYGIEMWVNFGNELAGINNTKFTKGLIFDYAKTPTVYYDYVKKALVMTIGEDQLVYESSNILYQTWNYIVVNYDYGTLDLFVNGELVSTTKNVSPYIKDYENEITIGSNEDPLYHSGICSVYYNTLPLKMSKIKSTYKNNRKSPCN